MTSTGKKSHDINKKKTMLENNFSFANWVFNLKIKSNEISTFLDVFENHVFFRKIGSIAK